MTTIGPAYIEQRVEFEPNTGCWLWSRGVNPDGYGWAGRMGAHRASWIAHKGRLAPACMFFIGATSAVA